MPDIILVVLIAFLLLSATGAIALLLKVKSLSKKFSELNFEKINYETICQKANDAVLVIDIVNGRILKSNPCLGEMLEYPQSQIEKLSVFDLHPKEMLQQSSEIIADVWEKKGLVYQNIPFVKSNGELLPVECSAKVVEFNGRPSIVIYARDIRERLRMEKEIQGKNKIIEQKNKDITDSINYAKRIQEAILPLKSDFQKLFSESFILYKPKDIVSGDFYWFAEVKPSFTGGMNGVLVAAADCTGHGVPGAFMSMIGNTLLNEIVNAKKITTPSEILNQLNDGVRIALKQDKLEAETRDGMDIALCCLSMDKNTAWLQYAGANRPLYLFKDGNLKEMKADSFPIGGMQFESMRNYSNHKLELHKGDIFYIFSDGYADQFGGEKGKKFTTKRLKELLLSIHTKSMKEQEMILKNTIESWMGAMDQIDDILVIGVKA